MPIRPHEPSAVRGTTPEWTAALIEEATGGSWLVRPPEGWSATGLCLYAPAMRAGNIVAVRGPEEGKGVLPRIVRDMDPRPVGLIVGKTGEAPLHNVPALAVPDVGEAILAMGRYSRSRMSGKVLAVTGSAGKTTAVAMLSHVLEAWGGAARTSHNANLPHGVAWNLASMGWEMPHLVLELAVGRMAQSARMARPHVAMVTNILPAHLGERGTTKDIAMTKRAIFLGMSPGGVAVLNRDMQEWETVHEAAHGQGLEIVHYGATDASDFQMLSYDAAEGLVRARVQGRQVRYQVGAGGAHMALNSLGVLAATAALGYPLEPAMERLSTFKALPGRGEELQLTFKGRRLTIIDDAYNANPGSMGAALGHLGGKRGAGRRIAVLGEMLDLGENAGNYHSELATLVASNAIDRVYAVGALYGDFWDRIPAACRGAHAASLDELKVALSRDLIDGDIVLFKGSNGARIHHLVSWMKTCS
ncbi:UDP-N-acetylmuramoyl-tripeptide--D-alanyl-D-alanine ligase [Nitratireductor thuwali]|uniref:UDP-N-acetylmuramoyl-tripeptide--D-alanyl-D-alanine ligase n=1 Tax=Nitratireductor thuwali TaxID=2267699 RepID=A0ABY5MT29_9HYPH|nr:UDP-N-acetylmuramoyl-tripeptide--D-alanyl-D-alanine ligase [Nitratireductor thuwali]